MKSPVARRLFRNGWMFGALVALCAVVSAVSVPAASANATCGGYTITNTTQTSFGLNEKVVIDVWANPAPTVDGVTWGGTAWSFKSRTQYSDHSSTIYGASDLGRGTHTMFIQLHGVGTCNIGSFSIV
jgi:hypothetical protein